MADPEKVPVPDPQEAEDIPAQPQETGTVPCHYCGADNPPYARTCPACGTDLQDASDEEDYDEEDAQRIRRRRNRKLIVLLVIIAVIVVAAILYALLGPAS